MQRKCYMDELMKMKEIHINPKNPRYIKDDRYLLLKKNLKEFPKMMKLRPIIIDDNGMILGGNMRYLAMIDLGYKEIPEGWVVKASELSEEEREKFKILDNVPFGNWDYDALANEWDLDNLKDWGVSLDDIAGGIPKVEDYSEMEEQTDALDGYEDQDIKITIPAMHEDKVIDWLANGEAKTAPGMGKGVLKRCGLL